MKVFDDTNYQELLPQRRERCQNGAVVGVHHANGADWYCSHVPTNTGRKMMAEAPNFGDVFPIFPRSEWSARIKEQKERKRRISDYQKFKAHAQTGPTCWANGPAHAFTTQRVIQGLPLVYISANSCAVPISGGVSGGDEYDAGEMALNRGLAACDVWPNGSRNRSLNTDQKCQESRKRYRALQLYSLRGTEQFMTACLMDIPFCLAVAFNWWSHVISGADPVEIEAGSFGWDWRNNWGDSWGEKNDYGFGGYVRMREGHGTPNSGFAFGPVLDAADQTVDNQGD